MKSNPNNMTQFENAKAVAAYMNEHPEGDLENWKKFAEEHGLVRFDYSDDSWFRNEEYVVCRTGGKYDIESIDRYDVKRKNVWRVMENGEPVSDWVDSLGDALDLAVARRHEQEEKGIGEPNLSFEKNEIIQ